MFSFTSEERVHVVIIGLRLPEIHGTLIDFDWLANYIKLSRPEYWPIFGSPYLYKTVMLDEVRRIGHTFGTFDGDLFGVLFFIDGMSDDVFLFILHSLDDRQDFQILACQ